MAEYFTQVSDYIDNLSDEEFDTLLVESGIEQCPYELRGDDLEIISEIKKYIPTNREDIWSWICYLENQLKEMIK